ncbi:MAG: MFS transporter [Bacteroidetes bacterium]|nr:MFS transporter [Bacteroidota bacterium]
MEEKQFTKPFNIFLLMMPTGISQGFVFVTLPYLLTHNGFSVAQTAAIVAVGASASLFRFVLGPIVDVSLSLRKWYWISLTAIISTLLILSVTPFTVKGSALLTAIVFISQVSMNVMLLPIGAFMATSIEESKKGKASGWYQAGSLTGAGLGGGAGLWLAEHYSASVAGIVLSVVSLAFAMIVLSLKDIEHQKEKTFIQELSGLAKDLLSMIKVPITLLAIILILLPIGTGAMANLWSAIADDWEADADTVALITGILSGLISALGCVVGGNIADRRGIWFAYLASGIACALVTIAMAAMPMNSSVYIGGVLFYAFTTGMVYAAFTSVLLFAIGKKHAATKFSLMGSLGNISVVYMTSFNGWMHDQYNSKLMLTFEAVLVIVCVLLFIVVLRRLKYKKIILL